MGISVLSLFDGLAGARESLKQAGIEVDKYYASEIEEPAMKVANKNYPDIVQLGDVCKIKGEDYKDIDLLIGGSPCQSLSSLVHVTKGIPKGLDGKSKLFFEYLRIKQEANPKYFFLENVASMKKKDRDYITACLGVEPVFIDSSILTPQIRARYYWTNIPILPLPAATNIKFQDILEEGGYTEREKSVCILATTYRADARNYLLKANRQMVFTRPVKRYKNTIILDEKDHYELLLSHGYKYNKKAIEELRNYIRKLTPLECERCQGLPDNYTLLDGVTDKGRTMMVGNGFSIPVVSHLLQGLKPENKNKMNSHAISVPLW